MYNTANCMGSLGYVYTNTHYLKSGSLSALIQGTMQLLSTQKLWFTQKIMNVQF